MPGERTRPDLQTLFAKHSYFPDFTIWRSAMDRPNPSMRTTVFVMLDVFTFFNTIGCEQFSRPVEWQCFTYLVEVIAEKKASKYGFGVALELAIPEVKSLMPQN